MRAVLFAYFNDLPIIFTQLQEPVFYERFRWSLDLSSLGIKNLAVSINTPTGGWSYGLEKNKIMNIFTLILIKFIKAYKYLISPLLGHSCRYLPTCSEYFIDSLEEEGVFRGIIKGTKRILSCHPIKFLGGGEGFDPVKKKSK